MMKLVRYLAFFIVSFAVGQTSSTETEVKQAITTFFEGFHKGDTTLMKTVLADKVLLQTAFKTKDGKDHLNSEDMSKLFQSITSIPEGQSFEEKLLDYNIQIDGNMAHVWTPYEFWFNGQFSHCGVNSFQLFQESGVWKIIYIIDTRRKEGCK